MEKFQSSAKFGCYMNNGESKIDFILVYDILDQIPAANGVRPEAEIRRLWFEENLKKQGLHLEFERVKEMEKILVFVKVHTPWHVLCRKAEELQIKLPLKYRDEEAVRFRRRKPNWRKLIENRFDSSIATVDGIEPISIINWSLKMKHLDKYAVDDKASFFSDRQRIEIVWDVLQKTANNPKNSKTRGVASLLERGIYTAGYALHDDGTPSSNRTENKINLRNDLKTKWASMSSILKKQPLWEIRNYFGEKVGFYFAFMEWYTTLLIFPSIISFLALVLGIYSAVDEKEIDKICKLDLNENGTTDDPENVADFWMCPLCEPPDCEPWKMYKEGCFPYKWAFRMDNEVGLILSTVVILWAILFFKFWKRRESKLAADWETQDAEEHDIVVRPQYEQLAPKWRRNPVTMETELYMPFSNQCTSATVSLLATLVVLLIASACLVSLVMSRIFLYGALKQITGSTGRKNVELARWGIHGMIFVVIFVFENFYHWLADKLTLYECHKTDRQFMNSFLWKLFIFKLLNDFVPIAYAAFIKGKTVSTPLDLNFLSELCDGGCIGEVTELVAVLLLARLIIGNVIEFGLPYIKNLLKRCRSKKVVQDECKPRWLKDYHLNEVQLDGVYKEYMEMMIQFAFVVFFTPAFPAAPLICFLNNIFEIRIDAVNLLRANRRPVPIRVSGIQIWNRFLDIIIKMGIVCKAALMSFSSDNIPKLYYKYYEGDTTNYVGYTKFSLSSIPVYLWHSKGEEMMSRNITECWYPHWRQNFYPFELKPVFWHIFALRLIAFSLFCLLFFLVMWLVNTFIDDIPSCVKTKIQRRTYLVNKYNDIHSSTVRYDNQTNGNNNGCPQQVASIYHWNTTESHFPSFSF